MRYHITIDMKIKNNNNQNKKILVTLAVALLIVGGVGAFYYVTHNRDGTENKSIKSGTNLNPATNGEKDAGNQAKSSTTENKDTSTNSSKGSGQEPTSPNSSTVNVQTTASAQNGTTYQLRYLINSVSNDALCTLVLTKGPATVTKTAKVQALAQSSTCQGFDIPTSELSPGLWQAAMTVSGGNISGSAKSTITVQ